MLSDHHPRPQASPVRRRRPRLITHPHLILYNNLGAVVSHWDRRMHWPDRVLAMHPHPHRRRRRLAW